MRSLLFPWLLFMSGLHVVLGIALIYIAHTDYMLPYLNSLAESFAFTFTPASEKLYRVIFQLFGPTIASWGLLFSMGLIYYRNQGHGLSKFTLIFALLIWFVLDSSISAYFSIEQHIYLNSLIFVLMFIPLLLLKPKRHNAFNGGWN